VSTHERETEWASRLARVATPPRDVEQTVREELRDGPTGIELNGSRWRARIAALPLIRHDGTQAIRIAFYSTDPIDVQVRLGESQATFAHTGGRTRRLLFAESEACPIHVEAGGEIASTVLDMPSPRRWAVYLVHHTHLDIGYTDPQPIVLDQHLRYLDATLELAAATDAWPEPARFRWNVEATLPLERWLQARPRVAREEFIQRVHEGRFEISALAYNMHTEAFSIDELARALRFADELRQRHDIEIVTAMQSDVPGAAPGLSTLLAAAGVRYLSVAHNYAGRSVPYLHGGQSVRRPFWWCTPGGERLLVWMTDSPHGVGYMEGNVLGLAESIDVVEELLPEYLAALAERPYPLSSEHEWLGLLPNFEVTKTPHEHELVHVRVQGLAGDNAPPSINPSEIVRTWNEQYAVPSLRLATNREFFTAAEARLGAGLDEWSGDWADWWADGIGSAARALGSNRQAQGAIRSGQTLNVLADQLGDEEGAWHTEVERSYETLGLFDEHTWGAGNPWSDALDRFDSGALQWERKVAFAHEASDRAQALVDSAAERLAHTFRPGSLTAGAILVVNGKGHARTDLIRVFVPGSRLAGGTAFTLRAPDGQSEPYAIDEQVHARFRAAGVWLSFVARNIPACGWARYDLVEGGDGGAVTSVGNDNPLEDERLRVLVDIEHGTVASLRDLTDGSEIVDTASAFGFNAYVYDRYASAPYFNHLSSRIPSGSRWLLGDRSVARNGALVRRRSNAIWNELTVRLEVAGADYLESTYRLVRGLGRLDVVNTLAKRPTDAKESVYFVFPFSGDDARIEWEVTGGVAGDGHANVPGSAQHMRAIRHWTTVATSTTQAAWATLEAPLVQRGDIHLPYRPFPGTVPAGEMNPATIVSWAMNNLWDTNFPPHQGGETTFRYAVAPGGRTVALDLAAALAQPLVGVLLAGRGHGSDDRQTGSFLEVDHPEVELVHLAPSRRGHDLVAVLHSHADAPVDVGLTFRSLRVAAVHVGSFLECDLRALDGPPRIRLRPGELVTLTFDLESRS
jgi:hypothetical protein